MSDQEAQFAQVRRHWEHIGSDVDISHEMYHDDAVLEFPQSGERFEGVANFKEWRSRYPADVLYRIRRMTASENLVVVECSVSYNGGPWQFGVQLLNFRGDKVARERIYVMEGWDAPEWRASWRSHTPADVPS
jgi:hypothetical protein